MTKDQLRKHIIKLRQQLSETTITIAAEHVATLTANSPQFKQAENIAFYISANNELNPAPLLQRAFALGKQCYLPVLHPLKHNQLWFIRYYEGDPLHPNRYGILEPVIKAEHKIAPWALDVVITPLVAFDTHGNRLGMGGGYYDRTFSFITDAKHKPTPHLIGLAYDFQFQEKLRPEPWDVRLNQVFHSQKA